MTNYMKQSNSEVLSKFYLLHLIPNFVLVKTYFDVDLKQIIRLTEPFDGLSGTIQYSV